MKIAASTGEKVLGVLMLAAAVVYLIPFVSRGWIWHDEGMLGESAQRVLQGGIPHVDYEEMYTGGLSWLYAAVFSVTSVDLLNLRWALFIGAALAVWLVYAVTRRYLRPAGAALATWLALAWSFPNYFAGLPSWWLLICALLCLWTLIRYVETQQWRYALAAGLSAGVAIAIKQTGVYLLLAAVLSLLYGGRRPNAWRWTTHVERMGRWAFACAAVLFACAILGSRIFGADGLYLLTPLAAGAVVFVLAAERERSPTEARSPLVLASLAAVAAALPLACLVIPYVTHGKLWELAYGTMVVPRKRLALVSLPMPDAVAAIAVSLPLLVLAGLEISNQKAQRPAVLRLLAWSAAVVLPVYALWNRISYQMIWQFARTASALLPIAIAWRLASGGPEDSRKRAVLFMSATMLTWMSLNQFPYAAPVYFCYVAPLAVIAAVAALDALPAIRWSAILPWAALLLIFAALSPNRSYLGWLGAEHSPIRFDEPLNLSRAHLNVGVERARAYRNLVASIRAHLHGGQLIAAPDCPEVYFLSGLTNPSGRLYDVLSNNVSDDAGPWLKGSVVVINHQPAFAANPSQVVVTTLRREFSHGERFGPFEIRWR